MKKRYVSIWFPFLATDWFALKQQQLRGKAFVLKASRHGRMVVTAASPEARKGGVYPGMVLADAKALFPGLLPLDDRPGLQEQLSARLAEWCIRFTPSAAAQPPDGILLDASGCTHLWGGEEAYLTDILKRLRGHGYQARAAIADTVGAAWAVARFARDTMIVPPGAQLEVLQPLPAECLRIEDALRERLQKLGLHKVADFVHLQRSALRRRFGEPLLLRLRQALGEEEEVITPIYPQEPFSERLPSLEPIVTATGITIALERLLQALCSRLQKEGKGLRTACFRCYRVDGGAQGIEIGTHRPSQNEQHLLQLFSLKLDTIEPRAGIELFVLEAARVEDYIPRQESLWESSGSMNSAQLSELMDRLAGKLGENTIRRYLPAEHYWPERSFRQAASLEDKPATEWRLDRPRPLQVLQTPERIDVTAPVPDYPPMLFRYKGVLHKIARADGPERIEQEWWIQEGEHRDYYCVEDEEGRRYWLFRQGHYAADRPHQWFLHGFFP